MPVNFGAALSKAGVPTSGTFQVETATVVGDITLSGDASVIVTAAGMTGSPITVAVPVDDGTLQVETATVVGSVTTDGDATVIVTAVGMTGSPITTGVTVDNGTAQIETSVIAGTITTSGNASVIVTSAGMTGSPITLAVAVAAGVLQVETATVVGTIEAAGAGDASVIVTAAGMTGSPITTAVAVANDDTASQVGGKIRTALGLDSDITDKFTVGGAGAVVSLTRVAPALANDATLNISIDNGTCAGLTPALTSVDTTAGVVADGDSAIATKIRSALTANAVILARFTIGGAGADVTLTRKTPFVANDATLNIAYADGTCVGLVADATSNNTTPGVAADDASAVGGKIRTALGLDSNITDKFTVGGTGANVSLTRIVPALADDVTANISIDNGTCAGLTPALTSTNSAVGGVADNASAVATKIRAALTADEVIGAFFTMSGATDKVILTRKSSAANDATINVAIDNDTCTGLTPAASSANTTSGVRGDYHGAGSGQYAIDTTNLTIYQNSGDEFKPTWVAQ